jgi:hypothetical protein
MSLTLVHGPSAAVVSDPSPLFFHRVCAAGRLVALPHGWNWGPLPPIHVLISMFFLRLTASVFLKAPQLKDLHR